MCLSLTHCAVCLPSRCGPLVVAHDLRAVLQRHFQLEDLGPELGTAQREELLLVGRVGRVLDLQQGLERALLQPRLTEQHVAVVDHLPARRVRRGARRVQTAELSKSPQDSNTR